MSITNCLPLLVPLTAMNMTDINLFSFIPSVFTKILVLGLIYGLTILIAKWNCWSSETLVKVALKALIPTVVFIIWTVLFYVPLTQGPMMIFGENIIIIVLLSILYKIIFDWTYSSC